GRPQAGVDGRRPLQCAGHPRPQLRTRRPAVRAPRGRARPHRRGRGRHPRPPRLPAAGSGGHPGMSPDARPDSRIKGAVTLRGAQVPDWTSDQKLLNRDTGTDWVHSDPWRVLRIQAEFVEGVGTLSELGPAVSLFGSARLAEGTEEPALAVDIARG